MSLSTRIASSLVLVITIFVVVDLAIQRRHVADAFEQLERRDALVLHHRARTLLDEGAARMGVRGAAMWARLSTGEASELSDFELDLLFVTAASGEVRFHSIMDPESNDTIELRRFPARGLRSGHPLIAAGAGHRDDVDPVYVTGLMETDAGILLACSMEHLDSTGGAGRLIAGCFLTDDLLDQLMAEIGATVEVWPLSSVPAQVVDADTHLQLTSFPMELVVHRGERKHSVLGMLTTVLKKPTLLMRSSTFDGATELGLRTARFSMLSTGTVALLILMTLVVLLRKIVIRPLGEVTAHAVDVRQHEYARRPLQLGRSDEIGQLAHEYNAMLDALADSRSEVVRSARLAGMSEIASGVIHNLGNALASVGVSIDQVRKTLRTLPVPDLTRVNTVLEEHSDDMVEFLTADPRGSTLPALLRSLEGTFATGLEGMLAEVSDLEAGFERMRKMVASQQGHATLGAGVLEPVQISAEVDSAIDICSKACSSGDAIEVVRDYHAAPTTLVDRYKLREILVNLIRNARQSIALERRTGGRLQISVSQPNPAQIRVEVRDNGEGISAEDLTQVFGHGFTTRKDGHGFGLHASANAARELGGELSAQSDGPGHGACFTLLVAFHPLDGPVSSSGDRSRRGAGAPDGRASSRS